LPFAAQLKLVKSSVEFSAMAKKVVIKQALTAATNKCSGDQIPAIPLGNSGGVATSMHIPFMLFNSGEHTMPLRLFSQFISTL
jgi:hypothetical protein